MDDRYHAMVEFLGTFSTLSGAPPQQLAELSDGVILFEALSEIAPDYFDPTTIAHNLGDNWALKASNLRKLLRNLQHYLRDGLQKDADLDLPVSAIAREQDASAIAELVELLCAAAVTGENKAAYVQRIMGLSGESQVAMKGILESGMARLSDFQAEEDQNVDDNELVFDQVEEEDKKDLFASAGNEFELSLQDARREIAALKSQMQVDREENEKSQLKLKAIVEDLQDRLTKRQDELIQAEEELRTATADLEDAQSKLREAEETKAQLADDLDVANAKTQQLHKAEATALAYKKKLENLGAMNQQMTELEDQAAKYLRQIMELESEVKKSNALQKTVQELQSQIETLQKEKQSQNSSNKSSASEIAELRSKLAAAESARKMFQEELSELRAKQESMVDEVSSPMAGLSLNSPVSAEQREKISRLEIENEQLKKKLESFEPNKPAPAVDTSAPVAVAVSTDDSSLKEELDRLTRELEAKEAEISKISSDKDKLEAYTKRTLAKFQDKYLVALQECKAKLKEKQDKIEALEARSASERTAQKREERLLSSTIYELGLAIMQNKLKER